MVRSTQDWKTPHENQAFSRLMNMEARLQYVICVQNHGYEDDLKLRTVYQVLPEESAMRSNYLRVLDETGEDYLFPAEFFVPVELPEEVQKSLFAV